MPHSYSSTRRSFETSDREVDNSKRKSGKHKFQGTYEQLKALFASGGIPGKWRDVDSNLKQFKDWAGGILNYWESNGTVFFQGREPEQLETLYLELVASDKSCGLRFN